MARKHRQSKETLFHSTSVISILGMRGCGKTYLSKKIQEIYPRVIIIDVTGEYSDGVECHDFEEFSKAILESQKQNSFRIIYHSHMDAGKEELETIDHCIRMAMLRSSDRDSVSNNLLLVLEEVQNYSSPMRLPHYLRYAYLTGRHHGMAVLATSQRPAEVHKTILSQTHNTFVGFVDEENDLKYLRTKLGNVVDVLDTLPDRQFILHRKRKPIKKLNNELVFSEEVLDTEKVSPSGKNENNNSEIENENPAL